MTQSPHTPTCGDLPVRIGGAGDPGPRGFEMRDCDGGITHILETGSQYFRGVSVRGTPQNLLPIPNRGMLRSSSERTGGLFGAPSESLTARSPDVVCVRRFGK